MKTNILIFMVLSFGFISGCGSGGSSGGQSASCSTTDLESQMSSILSGLTTDADFAFTLERSDGHVFNFTRGSATMSTSYESASTSKLVSAVIILRAVDKGYLTLTAKPQDLITSWPVTNSDSLYNMTLTHLLSFRSGLRLEANCLNVGASNFENCITNIANANVGNGVTPGAEFYYSSSHMQVAGLMAIKATPGATTWQNLFSTFKSETGLFATSTYDLPSSTNPRLAGGMHWTGTEYLAFLKKLKAGQLLSTTLLNQMLTDQTATATIGHSPAVDGLNQDWHYGFGIWHECASTTFNCPLGNRVSSPGTYGAYPFWNRSLNYVGMLARQGGLSTFPNGILVEQAVRTQEEAWAACK
jgi:CubicO group peptidase (beta-lactamase class C family)